MRVDTVLLPMDIGEFKRQTSISLAFFDYHFSFFIL